MLSATMDSMPIVDFKSCSVDGPATEDDYEKMGRHLVGLLSSAGCVYLKNSGITKKSVDHMHEITGTFFKKPMEEKQQYDRDPETNFGYVGIGVQRVDPTKPGDYKEGFGVSCETGFSESPNWPDELVPGFSGTVKGFMGQCKELGFRVLQALSAGLQLEEGHGLANCHKHIDESGNTSSLKSLYYPPLPESYHVKEGQLRLGAHADYGTVTLLFQDDAGGLEMLNDIGEFVDVTPVDDAVLIIVGEMLKNLTHGKLKTLVHRVRLPADNEKEIRTTRRSMAYFMSADDETKIGQALVYKEGSDAVAKSNSNAEGLTARQLIQKRWTDGYGTHPVTNVH